MITAAGLTTSHRKARDGFTLFGTITSETDEEMNKMIDFDLNLSFTNNSHLQENMSYYDKKPNPLIFMIYFRIDQEKYFIKAHKQPENHIGNELPYIIVQINKPYVRIKFYQILNRY